MEQFIYVGDSLWLHIFEMTRTPVIEVEVPPGVHVTESDNSGVCLCGYRVVLDHTLEPWALTIPDARAVKHRLRELLLTIRAYEGMVHTG